MSTRLPHTAPARLPRPPRTAPVSSAMDSVSVKAPGETIDVVTASSAPARPAQAALTTNARIRSLATLRPLSAAATSSSRTARQPRPTRLRARLASSTRVISAAAQVSHACQRVSGKLGPRKPGTVRETLSPWSPPNTPAYLVAIEGSAGHQHHRERPAEVHGHECGGVCADGHERPVADGDLAAQPHEHSQSRDRDHITGDLGDLVVAEGIQPHAQDHDDHADDDRDGQVAKQGHGHTCRVRVEANRPDGRTIRTTVRAARPNNGTRSAPRYPPT